jgi:hypothetical protein
MIWRLYLSHELPKPHLSDMKLWHLRDWFNLDALMANSTFLNVACSTVLVPASESAIGS